MGVVHRAHQPSLGRDVAVKFIRAAGEYASHAGVERFKREMNTLIALSHPNIVKLLDADATGDQLYYVMELLAARDVETLLEDGPLPVATVLSILDQILDALDYAHGKGFVHRDLKPANIMLEPSGRAILMDFGLALDPSRTALTAVGRVMGTPFYLAPELILGKPATPASDLFGLGVSAFQMLTGEQPFTGDNLKELASSILQKPTPSLRERRAEVPEELEAIVTRMLEKRPADRFPSAAQARQRVRDLAAAGSARAAPAGGRTGRPSRRIPRPGSGERTGQVLRSERPTAKVAASLSRRHDRRPSPVLIVLWTVLALLLGIVIGAVSSLRQGDWLTRPASPSPSPSASSRPVTR